MELTGMPVILAADRMSELPPLPKVAITFDELTREVANTQQAEQRLRTLFSEHPVFNIAYEDIHPDASCIGELQEFLDVEPMALKPSTVKISVDSLQEALTNFGDLAALARGTPYEEYFT